ncbi:MAG: HD-GYP domain-containing protein [Myxococcota bacterium]
MSEELVEAQEALGKAIDQARAGEDRELAQQVREAGEQLVRLLTGLLRLMRTHTPDNHAFDQPTHDFSAALGRLTELLGPVHMVCVEGQVYLNDIRIRMDERIGGGADLNEELARHGCGGLSFGQPLTQDQVRVLLHVLAAKPAEEKPLSTLQHALRDATLSSVSTHGMYRLRLTGDVDKQPVARREVQETLKRASGLIGEAWENLAASRVPNPLPVRRLVNELVDNVQDAERLLEAEAKAGTQGAAHERHSLRVATLATMIGAELGLSSAALADLGVAAMFHDVGYGAREDGFPPPFERHGSAGARMLLRQRGFHQAKVKRILVAFEHHRPLSRRPSLYARIVKVAEDFDTLTRPRPGGPLYGPAHALALMDGASGTLYDPTLLQLFVNRLGRFPPGTLLLLRDGRTVVSLSGARSPETFARPLARVVRDAAGQPVDDGAPLDLAVEGEVAKVIPVRG